MAFLGNFCFLKLFSNYVKNNFDIFIDKIIPKKYHAIRKNVKKGSVIWHCII